MIGILQANNCVRYTETGNNYTEQNGKRFMHFSMHFSKTSLFSDIARTGMFIIYTWKKVKEHFEPYF